jgi:predicted O-methyltransferase YrrM
VSGALAATSLPDWAHEQRDMAPHIWVLTRYALAAKTIIELGTRGGVSTWAFLDGLPHDGALWSVDIESCVVPPRVSGDPRWTFIRGDDTSPRVQRELPAHADLVLIDTSHEYRHTLVELDFALTRSPRRIVCHDAEWSGVARAIIEFCVRERWRVAEYHEAGDERGGFSLAMMEPA